MTAPETTAPIMRRRDSALILIVFVMAVVAMALPRMPEPASYHCFADSRSWLGVPNTLNVLSNLLFALVGALGLLAVFGHGFRQSHRFVSSWERWPYAALFGSVALTSVGSAYYHLAPDNTRLVWDRLPMAIGFMGLLSATISERVSVTAARRAFLPLLALGALSVLYWFWTERHGAGDLRLYGLVQFGSIILIVLLVITYRATYSGVSYLALGLVTYAIAILLDRTDHQVFAITHVVSGHTLKHLVAAAAVAFLAAMLQVRAPLASFARR